MSESGFPSGAPEFNSGFSEVGVADQSLVLCVMFWPLHCLSFFYLQLHITPWVSSKVS
jgi:hypothetical protein